MDLLAAGTYCFTSASACTERQIFKGDSGGEQRDVRNECLHLGADGIGLESACEESAACLGRAFSDCKAAAAAEDLGPLGHGPRTNSWESEDASETFMSISWCPALHLGHSE